MFCNVNESFGKLEGCDAFSRHSNSIDVRILETVDSVVTY